MSTTFYPTIPQPNDIPSVSQGQILTNFQSISNWAVVDHIGYGTINAGKHDQVSMPDVTVQAAQTGNASVIFTELGTLNNTSAQAMFANAQGKFPINLIRAFGTFTTVAVPGTVTLDNYYNVNATATGASLGITARYSITLAANIVTGNNVCVLISTGPTTVPGSGLNVVNYDFTNPTLRIRIDRSTAGQLISFAVLQF